MKKQLYLCALLLQIIWTDAHMSFLYANSRMNKTMTLHDLNCAVPDVTRETTLQTRAHRVQSYENYYTLDPAKKTCIQKIISGLPVSQGAVQKVMAASDHAVIELAYDKLAASIFSTSATVLCQKIKNQITPTHKLISGAVVSVIKHLFGNQLCGLSLTSSATFMDRILLR